MVRTFWEHIAAQQEGDKLYLKKHGLDQPLVIEFKRGGRASDWGEIERQTDYLIAHHQEMPQLVAARRATELLAHYMTGREPPSPKIVLLMGTLLNVSAVNIKYAKKPHSLLFAREYAQKNPKASNGQIAREVGVHKSTIGRWRREGLF